MSPKIVGEEAPAPATNVWYDELRPVLHQAIHYTSPTYFLDTNLTLIDWNLAFELIFSRSLARIHGKHVKHFIVQLANYDQVIDHAQEFTKKVHKGKIPFVDLEPLSYSSERYGDVSFLKVATQLHDPQGKPRGWSVSLMIRDIDWERFLARSVGRSPQGQAVERLFRFVRPRAAGFSAVQAADRRCDRRDPAR